MIKRTIFKLRHIILFAILIAEDIVLAHFSYNAGKDGTGYGITIGIAIIVVIAVELLFRGGRK